MIPVLSINMMEQIERVRALATDEFADGLWQNGYVFLPLDALGPVGHEAIALIATGWATGAIPFDPESIHSYVPWDNASLSSENFQHDPQQLGLRFIRVLSRFDKLADELANATLAKYYDQGLLKSDVFTPDTCSTAEIHRDRLHYNEGLKIYGSHLDPVALIVNAQSALGLWFPSNAKSNLAPVPIFAPAPGISVFFGTDMRDLAGREGSWHGVRASFGQSRVSYARRFRTSSDQLQEYISARASEAPAFEL